MVEEVVKFILPQNKLVCQEAHDNRLEKCF